MGEAEGAYCAAVLSRPDLADAWAGLSGVMCEQLRWDESRRAANRALREDPGHPEAAWIRGVLRERRGELPAGVMHCYSGSVESAKEYLDLGFYLSFAGPVTFKNAHKLQEAARFCPADRLLVETDSPYLTPVPLRGKLKNK